MALVLYAATQRTGGAADQTELARQRTIRAGTIAAKTELDVTKVWEEASAAANTECGSGPVKLRRGPKCTAAEERRDAAWRRVELARQDLKETPDAHPNSGTRRVAALLPVTEAHVQLYQPLLVPVVMALLASVFLLICTSLRHDPLPKFRLKLRSRRLEVAAPRSAYVNPSPPPASHEAGRTTMPSLEKEIDADPIIAFMKAWVPYREKAKAEWGEMFDRCLDQWSRQGLEADPPTRAEFDAVLTYICKTAGIRTSTRNGKVYCLDRKLLT